MNWHDRFKKMKDGLGYTNTDIAKITGNTPDSIKSSTQPNKEIPRWLKLAIVVFEVSNDSVVTAETLRTYSRENIEGFIRSRLSFDRRIVSQLRYTNPHDISKEHRRFEMSGYESKTGECTVHNLAIVNLFADLGIYDFTKFLFLDFHKGTPTLYWQYWHSYTTEQEDFSGYGTVEIIYEIFERTIFTDKPKRRRI